MKRISNLMKSVTLVSLSISFLSFGIAAMESLIGSASCLSLWYIGMAAGLIALLAAVAAFAAPLFDYGSERNMHSRQLLKRHARNQPHTANRI